MDCLKSLIMGMKVCMSNNSAITPDLEIVDK